MVSGSEFDQRSVLHTMTRYLKAPHDKPVEALSLIKRWLAGESFRCNVIALLLFPALAKHFPLYTEQLLGDAPRSPVREFTTALLYKSTSLFRLLIISRPTTPGSMKACSACGGEATIGVTAVEGAKGMMVCKRETSSTCLKDGGENVASLYYYRVLAGQSQTRVLFSKLG